MKKIILFLNLLIFMSNSFSQKPVTKKEWLYRFAETKNIEFTRKHQR